MERTGKEGPTSILLLGRRRCSPSALAKESLSEILSCYCDEQNKAAGRDYRAVSIYPSLYIFEKCQPWLTTNYQTTQSVCWKGKDASPKKKTQMPSKNVIHFLSSYFKCFFQTGQACRLPAHKTKHCIPFEGSVSL